MKKQNNNEEIERNQTQNFLPSDGASCSFSSVLADVVGNRNTPRNTKAVARAAKESGGIVVMRYVQDAQMMKNVYGAEAVALSEIKKAAGKLMFWESGAIYGLAM